MDKGYLRDLKFDYILKFEIVTINYTRTFDGSDDIIKEKEVIKHGHISYTQNELQQLQDNVDKIKYVD